MSREQIFGVGFDEEVISQFWDAMLGRVKYAAEAVKQCAGTDTEAAEGRLEQRDVDRHD